MAKQISLIQFTGRLGNLIGYRCKGEYYLRSMPEKVRQTAATRRAAQRFGISSRKGRLIRSAFAGALDVHCDGGYINRLNRTLILGGNRTEAVAGFRFNGHTGIERFFHAPLTFGPEGILHIPAQAAWPRYGDITALEIKVIAAHISFADHRVVHTETAAMVLDLREPFAGAALAVDVPGMETLVVVLQVRGMRNDGSFSCDRRYYAADIIAVREPAPQAVIRKAGKREYTGLMPVVHRRTIPSSGHSVAAIVLRE